MFKESFQHQIWVLHSHGEACVFSFRADRLFNTRAHDIFDREATRNWFNMRRVHDITLAGYHYANSDGTVVLELR